MTGIKPGEWYVIYHDTNIGFAQSILTTKLKTGGRQTYYSDDDINHPRRKS